MLQEYLDKMLAITLRIEPHLIGPAPAGTAELAQARAEQARTITAYQLYVHREIFEPMIRNGSPVQIGRARAMKVECIMLAEDFRAFARLWNVDNALDQWPVYQSAALALRDRIRAHVDHVKKEGAFWSVAPVQRSATRF